MKRCPGYAETMAPEAFYRNASRRDGLSTYCRPCEKTRSRPYQLSLEGRAGAAARAKKRRVKLVDELGGHCACCGEATYEFLQFDHKHGDGAEHRRLLGRSRFQLLCANCNFAKGAWGRCPHTMATV